METGAITQYIDVAQLALYGFWIFFLFLVLYLLKENKREGYPLVAEDRRNNRVMVQGFPAIPDPKTFRLFHGGTYTAPPGNIDTREIAAVPAGNFPGAPLEPTGNPMIDGIGTAAWAMRQDVPDTTAEGANRIVPNRVDPHHFVVPEDPNPVGMNVIAADRKVAGVVREIWIDRSEPRITYLEVEVPLAGGRSRMVLLPQTMAVIDRRARLVRTGSILASQFADVPVLKNPDEVTKLEEDQICAYFAGGYLYATPDRKEPLI
ncbi:MAG: subunit of photosynthetic reaction center complex [Pseudomonadota bacterium]|jgi:photosynthetic reaction center H subunit